MIKIRSSILILILSFVLFNCSQVKEKHHGYENQIGDTPFSIDIDDPNFEFCDSTNVLHKRAYVGYEGGMKAIEEEITSKYNLDASYKSYSGYFIIRLAVNCNDRAGRYRMQILDSNFGLAECPDQLEKHILSIVKGLKGWKRPFYDGKYYDGYKFLSIKIVNGQIK